MPDQEIRLYVTLKYGVYWSVTSVASEKLSTLRSNYFM